MEGNMKADKNICSREKAQGSSTVLSSLVVSFHAKQQAGVDKAESSSQHYHKSQNPWASSGHQTFLIYIHLLVRH